MSQLEESKAEAAEERSEQTRSFVRTAARTDSSISKRRSQLLEGGITNLRLLRTADGPLTRNFQRLFICRLSAIMGHARATQPYCWV